MRCESGVPRRHGDEVAAAGRTERSGSQTTSSYEETGEANGPTTCLALRVQQGWRINNIIFCNNLIRLTQPSETSSPQNDKAAVDIIMIDEGGQNYRQESRL